MLRKSIASTVFVLFMSICCGVSNAIQCYDCYGTGPDHKECTQQRSCNGVACMIFDAGDNQTASAFCLLAMKGNKMDDAKDGCWLEPDGKGKHCMCFTDYCNKLVDRRNTDEVDPMAPLLPTAEFLKQNPLVDYDAPNLGDYVDDGAHPAPKHVLFPSADKQDSKTAGGNDDDDLVPVAFEDYKDEEVEPKTSSSTPKPALPNNPDEGFPLPVDPEVEIEDDDVTIAGDDEEDDDNINRPTAREPNPRVPEDRHENEISSSFKPPSWVLLVFPMAASWARFVAGF